MSTPLGGGQSEPHGSPEPYARPADHWDEDRTVVQPHGRRAGGAPNNEDDRVAAERPRVDHDRARREFGGIKWGAAFFGWLTATGAIVLLVSLVAAVGAVVDQTTGTDVQEISQNPQSAGLIGGAIVLVVLFVGYFCGGYVAGRMARFDGARQGFAVWIWMILMTALLTVLGFLAGDQLNFASQISGLPSLPIAESDRTVTALVAGGAVLLLALIAAILGGLAGMRFHRKVDAAATGR